MHILAVGRSHPEHYYKQEFILEKIQELWGSTIRESDKLARFHTSTTVEGRYIAAPIEEFHNINHFGHSNDIYIKVGLEVAEKAVQQALQKAGLQASDVDAIFLSSVTGIAVPTMDARLIHKMGFRENVKRFPFFGLGCVAGAAGTARVNDYLVGHPDQVALLICLELCSLTFQSNDYDVPNLIGTGLFGDGCAAMLAVGSTSKHISKLQSLNVTGPRVLDSSSRIYPDSERIMGWDISDKGFKIVLSSGVPEIVKQYLGEDIDNFLKTHQLKREQITSWVCHPGGPKVIDAIIETMNLTEYDLAITRESLKKVGNMSSASVLFVLGETIENRRPAAGEYGLLLAMGPGFVSELVLIQW